MTGDSRPPNAPSSDGVTGTAVATMSTGNVTPSTATVPSTAHSGNESSSVNGQPASGYNSRSLAGFAAWQAGHAIGTTMRWAGMGAEQ